MKKKIKKQEPFLELVADAIDHFMGGHNCAICDDHYRALSARLQRRINQKSGKVELFLDGEKVS